MGNSELGAEGKLPSTERTIMYGDAKGMQCWQNGPDKAGNQWELKLLLDSKREASFYAMI